MYAYCVYIGYDGDNSITRVDVIQQFIKYYIITCHYSLTDFCREKRQVLAVGVG